MHSAIRLLLAVAVLIAAPLLLTAAALVLAITDLAWLCCGKRRPRGRTSRSTAAASIVIPNWNGRDLLERYLPSVIAATAGNPQNEIIIVDNGSGDGSAAFIRERFPEVRLLAFERNLGFGGGSNEGFRAAKNDVVVLLNSDMRVAPNFLQPLLEGFRDESVFAVACQIFFSDPSRRREETGLSEGRWRFGALHVSHRVDETVTDLYPAFYGGGGSCAFDRRRFLELGGFEALLKPFYLEDTDIGFMAWKRGWTVLYQPRSVVFHEHRGTIGRHFSREYIEGVYKKNFLLFTWKNIHSWRRLLSHFVHSAAHAAASALLGNAPHRTNLAGISRAFLQLPGAAASRWRSRSLAVIGDDEAFRRPQGGYFRDRFIAAVEPLPEKPRVLFVSPYPICPPVHGGGVFMYSTLKHLAPLCDLHLLCLLEDPGQLAPHAELAGMCASAEFLVRDSANGGFGSVTPHAVREFASQDVEWAIQRTILTRRIDLVQLDYTSLAQYRCDFRRIAQVLFEHDIYFQSLGRGLRLSRPKAAYEYLRALRYELRVLPHFDRIQVCSRENMQHLLEFLPEVAPKLQDGLRAGIDCASYEFRPGCREPDTMLFLGSFRHVPNQEALEWFMQRVLPRILDKRPSARLVIVGSEPPPHYALPSSDALELRGFVEDIREPLSRYACFICPILTGSGVRVKLLEAFAAGIPAISTGLGAEGVARKDGEFCVLADEPEAFASGVLRVLGDPAAAAAMAGRARHEVEAHWDSAPMARALLGSYEEVISEKRRQKARATEPACA